MPNVRRNHSAGTQTQAKAVANEVGKGLPQERENRSSRMRQRGWNVEWKPANESTVETKCPKCVYNVKHGGDCAGDYEGCGRYKEKKR